MASRLLWWRVTWIRADLIRQRRRPSQVIGDYFTAMGVPLLRGRLFTESDNANNQLVAIVNHEFARTLLAEPGPDRKAHACRHAESRPRPG